MIAFPAAVTETIRGHVEAMFPFEACGVVFRVGEGYEVRMCRNVAKHSLHEFRVGLKDLLAIARQRWFQRQEVVAIYHSHCAGPAVMSARDRASARHWPGVVQLIACVTARGMLALHAYDADGTCVDEDAA